MTDSGQLHGVATDSLVHLFVFSRFPDGSFPAQALDAEFLSGLVKFVEAASARPDLLDSISDTPKSAVDSFLVRYAETAASESTQNVPMDGASETQDKAGTEGSQQANVEMGTEPGVSRMSRAEITRLSLETHTRNAFLSASQVNPPLIPKNAEFLAYLMPEQVPEQIQERRSLVELYLTAQSQPVSQLLSGAHKTLRTEHYKLSLIEGKLGIIHNRIEELRNNERWSLRQRVRFIDPITEKTQWDYLQEEMRWMSTNYREERKFHIAIAAVIAREAAEVVANRAAHDPIKTASIVPKEETDMPLISTEANLDPLSQALFATLKQTTCFTFDEKFTREWDQLPYIPISKFLVPPEDIKDWHRVIIENPRDIPELLTNMEREATLLERIFNRHPANVVEVRAPKPPDSRYINYRLVTIWLPEDDKALLGLAGKLSYNWDLVSSYLMQGLHYTADIERRTPWQCFERWLQLNPTFDVKDLKGRYAEQARIWLDSSSKTQLAVKRRIAPVGVSADNLQRGHKRLRWSSMFDAIRKVKRKRESQPKGNPMRRQAAIESAQTQGTPARGTPTAAELSRVKFERDRAVADVYAQEQRAQGGARTRPNSDAIRGPSQGARPQSSVTPSSAPNPTPNTTIAGLPVPNSVAAAAAANAANNSQFSQEQLQQYLNRRKMADQNQAAQVAGAQKAPAGPPKPYGQFMTASPQMQKSGFPSASPLQSPSQRQAQVQAQTQGTPRRGPPQLTPQQAAAVMAKIAQRHPNLTREQVQQLARQEIQLYIQKRSAAQAAQAARNAQQAQVHDQARAQAQAQAQARAQAQVHSNPSSQTHSRAGTPPQPNQNFMR